MLQQHSLSGGCGRYAPVTTGYFPTSLRDGVAHADAASFSRSARDVSYVVW